MQWSVGASCDGGSCTTGGIQAGLRRSARGRGRRRRGRGRSARWQRRQCAACASNPLCSWGVPRPRSRRSASVFGAPAVAGAPGGPILPRLGDGTAACPWFGQGARRDAIAVGAGARAGSANGETPIVTAGVARARIAARSGRWASVLPLRKQTTRADNDLTLTHAVSTELCGASLSARTIPRA